jgi:hypothetical protein
VERHNAGGGAVERKDRGHNYDDVRGLVAERVRTSRGKISAKRLLPAAWAGGYAGSARNFRRLAASRRHSGAGSTSWHRPPVWTPGDALVIDWGVLHGVHVFCTVLTWSRVRSVRFAGADDAEAAGRVLRGARRGTQDDAG